MVDKSKLINSLVKLEMELHHSPGKVDTVDFFTKTIVAVTSETDVEKLKQLLEKNL